MDGAEVACNKCGSNRKKNGSKHFYSLSSLIAELNDKDFKQSQE